MTAAFIVSCFVALVGRIVWEVYDVRTRTRNSNIVYISRPWVFWEHFHYAPLQFILLDVPQGAVLVFFVLMVIEGIGG